LSTSYWECWQAGFCNPGSYQSTKEDCAIAGGKPRFPLEIHNFQGEFAQLLARPSTGEQPVRGMDQAVTNRLPLCKKDTKACELDEARQVTVKVGSEAPK